MKKNKNLFLERSFFEKFNSQMALRGNETAIIIEQNGIEVTYENLSSDVKKIAYHLWSCGVRNGDVVASQLPNGYEALLMFLASTALGIKYAPCALDDPSTVERLARCVPVKYLVLLEPYEHVGETVVAAIYLPQKLNELEIATIPTSNSDQLAASLFLLTSGSTGNPKIMSINCSRLWDSAEYFLSLYATVNQSSRFWNYLPMSYLGGLFNLSLIPIVAGASFVLSDGFDATAAFRFWDVVKKYKVDTLWFVPSIANLLLRLAERNNETDNKSNGALIKTAFIGTAPVGLHLKTSLVKKFGIRAYENFGLSETTFLSAELPGSQISDSSGKILDCIDYKLEPVSYEYDTAPSELYVKTPFLFEGYIEENSGYHLFSDGSAYFPTGDIVEVQEGQLTILGRSRDIIKKGGQFIGLAEIENLLSQHPSLLEVVAVKVEDKFYGENYVIFYRVLEKEKVDESELRTMLAKNLPKNKMPQSFYEVVEIPRTRSGKVRKHVLSSFAPYFQNKKLDFKRPVLSLSKTVSSLKPALSIDINQIVYSMKRSGEKIITLSLGEAFFDLPKFKFSGENFEKGYHYSDTAGLPSLRERVAEHYRAEYSAPVFSDEIVISAGSKPLVFMALKAILEPGDTALIHEPGWLSYAEQINLCGSEAKYIPFDVEVKDFGKYFQKNTRLLIINNPNNPRGKIYSIDELTEIYRIARSRGAYVLVDEAYSDFTDMKFHSMAEVVPDKDGVVIINSLSKNFGISGWRIGYVIADQALRHELIKLNQHLITCAPTILCMYVEKHFSELLKSTKKQIDALLAKRERLQRYMDKIKINYLSGGSTFYFFVSIENFYGSDEEFAKILLIRYKIAVVPGSAYGDTTHRFIRLSFGTETDEDIRYALDCIKNVMTTRDHDLIAINAEYESWRSLS